MPRCALCFRRALPGACQLYKQSGRRKSLPLTISELSRFQGPDGYASVSAPGESQIAKSGEFRSAALIPTLKSEFVRLTNYIPPYIYRGLISGGRQQSAHASETA